MSATTRTASSPGPAPPGRASPSTTSPTPTRPSPTPARARRPRSPPWAACSSSSCASSSKTDTKKPRPTRTGLLAFSAGKRLEDQLRHGVIVAQLALDEGVEGNGIAGLAGYIRIDGMGLARRKQEDLALRRRHRGDGRVVDIALVGRGPQVDLLIAGLAHKGHGRRRFRQLAIVQRTRNNRVGMGMAMHAGIGFVDQRPGLGHVQPLGNAHHLRGIDIQNLLHRVLDALQLRFLEDVLVLRDQVLDIVPHLQLLDEVDLLGADGAGDAGPKQRLREQGNDLVSRGCHSLFLFSAPKIGTFFPPDPKTKPNRPYDITSRCGANRHAYRAR